MNDFEGRSVPQAPIQVPSIIETASATTDPDNSNSGPFAYVVFGVVAALMLLFVLLVTGIIGSLGGYVSTDIALNDTTLDLEDLRDLDDLLDNDYLRRFVESETELTA